MATEPLSENVVKDIEDSDEKVEEETEKVSTKPKKSVKKKEPELAPQGVGGRYKEIGAGRRVKAD